MGIVAYVHLLNLCKLTQEFTEVNNIFGYLDAVVELSSKLYKLTHMREIRWLVSE